MKTQAIAYIRVSSKKQVKDGSSLEAQEEIIRKYADYNNIEITQVFADRGVSASTGNRPAFEQVMQLVKDKKVGAVVVYSISRFARNTRKLLECVELMKKNKIGFHSFKEKIDIDTAMGEFFITVIGASAQLESMTTGERIYDAKMQGKENGRTYSAPIYGFDNDAQNHRLTPNDELMIVKSIIKDSETKSYGQIANKLNSENVPTKKGNKWYRSTVSNIVNNSVYKNM